LLLGWYTFLQKFVKRCTFGVPSTPKYTKMVHPVVHLFTYTRYSITKNREFYAIFCEDPKPVKISK